MFPNLGSYLVDLSGKLRNLEKLARHENEKTVPILQGAFGANDKTA